MKTILVTGGAGYIGSHTLVELYKSGYKAVVVDNLVNSNKESLRRVEQLTGAKIPFYEIDVRDSEALCEVLDKHQIDACIHFAGLKAVGESVEKPLEYYQNNMVSTFTLIEQLRNHNFKNIIFSSSATVYGNPGIVSYTEDLPKGKCTSPYGSTKSMLEDVLLDIQKADTEWNVILLRYFNPIGAHPSGLIGEDPHGIPNNLMPYITQVAIGKRPYLGIFGDDYPTHDGTGIRDYIHVVDLAKGHVMSLSALFQNCGAKIYNLGNGRGYSVLDVVKAFEKVNKVKVPCKILPRRSGDLPEYYSNPSKANKELGWKAEYGIEEMVRDSWNWQRSNPEGYTTK